jgi:hypothetical protein
MGVPGFVAWLWQNHKRTNFIFKQLFKSSAQSDNITDLEHEDIIDLEHEDIIDLEHEDIIDLEHEDIIDL